jgi:trehalose/maltose hydrolase-like predicted phosphorylase
VYVTVSPTTFLVWHPRGWHPASPQATRNIDLPAGGISNSPLATMRRSGAAMIEIAAAVTRYRAVTGDQTLEVEAGLELLVETGFGGMRDSEGLLSFAPQLPDGISRLSFTLRWRGQLLGVDIEPDQATYTLRDGAGSSLVFATTEKTSP